MTFRHLKIFIAVAQAGSMSAAARELYIAQPTVSQVIAEIENEYGIRLFERLSRRLYITREGRQLLDYARHITALFEERGLPEPDSPGGRHHHRGQLCTACAGSPVRGGKPIGHRGGAGGQHPGHRGKDPLQ